jgi:hypothetical protein
VTAVAEPTRNGTAPAPAPVEDWDAFWSTHVEARRPKARIRGVEVTAPYDLPLELAERMQEANANDTTLVQDLLAELYGEGIVEQWTAAGMGSLEFFVVLTWSYMRAGGSSATFADAFDAVQKGLESGALDMDAQQPVPNRADKRAAAKAPKGRTTPSGRTGARSSRTSAASTSSSRPKSQS